MSLNFMPSIMLKRGKMEAVLLLGLPPRPTFSVARKGIGLLTCQAALSNETKFSPCGRIVVSIYSF